MASSDGRPVPKKGVAYRVTFPIWDADGDLVTGAAGLDSEVSKDGGAFADCTNEATEIATASGVYYLDLTSTEMDADTVAVIVKTSTSGAKTTAIILYPEEAGDIRVDVTAFGGTAGTFASGIPEVKVASIAAGAITETSIAADAITDAKVASDVTIASVTGSVGSVTGAVGSVTGNVGGNVVGSVGSLVGYTAPLDAAGTRTALGLANADLDTQLGALPTTAEARAEMDDAIADADLATAADIAAIPAAPTANQNADALLDRANAIEAGVSPRLALRYTASVAFGVSSGMTSSGGTAVFDAAGNPGTPRVEAPLDASGNRTGVTLS